MKIENVKMSNYSSIISKIPEFNTFWYVHSIYASEIRRQSKRFLGAPVEWVTGQKLDINWTNVQGLSHVCPRFV